MVNNKQLTMNNEEKNNILIAEFMGWKVINCVRKNGTLGVYQLTGGFDLIQEVETTIESNWCEILEYQDYATPDELLFSSSWDWLMPVVKKCKERQFYGSTQIINAIHKRVLEIDLVATHRNVVDFINQYNIQKDGK